MKDRIWGIEYEEIQDGDHKFWLADIKSTFYFKGKFCRGISVKFIKEAIRNGVDKFIIRTNGKEEFMEVPSLVDIAHKDRDGEYEDRPSKFPGGYPMRIYYFEV